MVYRREIGVGSVVVRERDIGGFYLVRRFFLVFCILFLVSCIKRRLFYCY